MPDNERSLAAIMFSDVVSYTSMAQKDEARTIELLDTEAIRAQK